MDTIPRIPIAVFGKTSKAVRDHEAARDRDEWLRDIADATPLHDYDDYEVTDWPDTFVAECNYYYHLPDGELTIVAQRCGEDHFAEIEDATLQVGDDEIDFMPYVKYMK